MKNIKGTFFGVLIVLLIPSLSIAQSKDNNQKLIITGITGESIKEALELDKSEKIIKRITKQVIKDKLVEGEKELSFMLNSEKFIINGITQSSEIHKKYKDKYIKDKKKWNICKNYKI